MVVEWWNGFVEALMEVRIEQHCFVIATLIGMKNVYLPSLNQPLIQVGTISVIKFMLIFRIMALVIWLQDQYYYKFGLP